MATKATSKITISTAAYAAEMLLKLIDEKRLPFGKHHVCPTCGSLPMTPHATDCLFQSVRTDLRSVLKNFRPGGSDPTVTRDTKVRLSRQAVAIRDRLLQGPATNTELAKIALKYTGRISDLRANGYEIFVMSADHSTGVFTYALKR